MDPDSAIQLAFLIVLIVLSGIFSSMETAMVTVNQIRVRALTEEGNKRAQTLSAVLDDRAKMLSAILIANNIINLSASALTTTLVLRLFGSTFVSIATGVLTMLILIFGEISPKNLATIHAEKMALAYAPLLRTLMTILTPVIFLINLLSRGFLRLIGVDPDAKPEGITETELRTIVDVSEEEGVIEQSEKKMINNVVDFGDAVVRDVMVPRIDMVAVPLDVTYEDMLSLFRDNMFTRMPVYEDTPDNVLGIINVKDLLLIDTEKEFHVQDYMREAFYTFETKHTAQLFRQMRQNCVNIAIVLNEYGATCGLITMEDLLEEIVGEIRDEYDKDETDDIVALSETEYEADGMARIEDINEATGLSLSSEEYDSIGGLMIELLDHIPAEGESIACPGAVLTTLAMDKNRVERVRILLVPEEVSEEDED